jgi:hypothetical protein
MNHPQVFYNVQSSISAYHSINPVIVNLAKSIAGDGSEEFFKIKHQDGGS